jgi:CDP-diacylglycerol--glycerol-3-phosphate 3-phosphatidyltransferase
MTVPNRISLFRLCLIPVFVMLAAGYGQSVNAGAPVEWQRVAAVCVFLLAGVSDAVDGWIARHYNQRSRLGAVLDPLADKGLMLSAIVTLSVTGWSEQHRFPLWFPVLVISRDVLSAAGAFLIKRRHGAVRIRPHWTGKVTNFMQITAIGWIMLRLDWLPPVVPTAIAAVFTVLSGMLHLADGLKQYRLGPPPPAVAPGA